MTEILKRLVREEEGQGMTEYALIIGLIAIAAIGVMAVMSGGINNIFNGIGSKLGTIVTP